jgi:hypothetical protein
MRHVIIALALAALAACGHASLPLSPTPSPIANRGTVFSVEVHPGDASSTTPTALAAIAAAGFSAIRTDYSPPPLTGYDYSWLAAAEAAGLHLVLITPYPQASDVADPSAYAALVADAVTKYPAATIELDNEPNDAAPLAQLQLTPAQYVAVMRPTIAAARAAHAATNILLGGVTTSATAAYGYKAWLQQTEVLPVDGTAVHLYGVPASAVQNVVVPLVVQYGRPVSITETGEAPPVGADLVALANAAKGLVAIDNFYEWRTQAGEPPYGLVGTDALAALSAVIR